MPQLNGLGSGSQVLEPVLDGANGRCNLLIDSGVAELVVPDAVQSSEEQGQLVSTQSQR